MNQKMPDPLDRIWECPCCGFVVSGREVEMTRFDYPCPRCRQYGIKSFRPAPKKAQPRKR